MAAVTFNPIRGDALKGNDPPWAGRSTQLVSGTLRQRR
jgi:hypothetical protein